MKKIIALTLALVMLAFTFASCGDDGIVGIVPFYVGETVYDENHEFKAEDFSVWVSYEDGQKLTEDFTFEVIDCSDGVYTIEITYKDWVNQTFVYIGLEKGTDNAE